ncbi:MAG: HIRAN domain-containing protein [Eggerthellaceae bacterium]|nr:HIRAN domain-containing protein [Eggerthellaceae bacterium]
MNASLISFDSLGISQRGICFIERTSVAGTAHIPGIRLLAQQLRAGERLVFERDASNMHDLFAVCINDTRGNRLGYLSCEFNEIVSRLMDGGKQISGLVRSVNQVGRWTKIDMAVVLDD